MKAWNGEVSFVPDRSMDSGQDLWIRPRSGDGNKIFGSGQDLWIGPRSVDRDKIFGSDQDLYIGTRFVEWAKIYETCPIFVEQTQDL